MTALVVVALVATLSLLAWWWVGFLVSVHQWSLERLASASRDSFRPSSLPGEGGHDQLELQRPQGVPSSAGGLLSSPPPACCTRDPESRGSNPLAAVPLLGVASQPDFDAFFGGLEAAVLAGGIAVIGLVVVLAVRRLTSF